MSLIQVLKLEPKNIKALFRSGVVKLNLNRLEEAEEDLKKAEELDPDGMGESTWHFQLITVTTFKMNRSTALYTIAWPPGGLPCFVPEPGYEARPSLLLVF